MSHSRTKQVCTIGPASAERIAELVAAGMDVARVNFAHGTPEEHRNYVHAVRAAAHSARRSVAVMVDLPGPKLRLGELAGGELRLAAGAEFTLRAGEATPADETTPTDGATGADEVIPVDEATPVEALGAVVPHAALATQLQVGDRVLLAGGAAELKVTAIDGSDVRTEVVNGGVVRSRSGVSIPSDRLVHVGLTDDDLAALARALELRADLIAQSFVRSADDVRALRALLPVDGPRLVAKIEIRSAIDDFDAICGAADGIMIARGDMGVDLPFERVPLIQKDLVRRATGAGKFSIVATQMLESMTGAARPTRAETSDVANAVLDGADAVMLSAETAIGAYPLEALQAMERICVATEGGDAHSPAVASDAVDAPGLSASAEAIVSAAARLADMHAAVDAIWCFTRSGRTAELLSLHRPRVPIMAFTLSPVVARRLAVRSGIVPLILPSGGKQEPQTLIQRMAGAWRGQRALGDVRMVVLVTTSGQPTGINRLELQHPADDRS